VYNLLGLLESYDELVGVDANHGEAYWCEVGQQRYSGGAAL
jgi:hypothetical protein